MGNSEINVLTGLETAKVALVKRGANRKPRFPVWKSEETNMDPEMQELLEAILEVEAENEGKIEEVFKQKLSEKGAQAVKGALRLLSAYKDELPKDVMIKLSGLAGYPAPKAAQEPQKDKDKEPTVKQPPKKDKEKEKYGYPMMKALDALDDEERAKIEPIVKALEESRAEEIAKAEEEVKKANDRAEEIAKTLKTERDERQTKEWIAKAETELSHYPGKSSEELGKMLKGLHDHDAKMAEEQFESMKAASDSIKKSALLRSVGTGAGMSTGSAEEKLEKMAKALIQKSEDGMSLEVAKAKVMEANPDLYQEYLSDNPAQTQPIVS